MALKWTQQFVNGMAEHKLLHAKDVYVEDENGEEIGIDTILNKIGGSSTDKINQLIDAEKLPNLTELIKYFLNKIQGTVTQEEINEILTKAIVENEEVVAKALIELNKKIDLVLPDTSNNENKVLTVENGEAVWKESSGGSGNSKTKILFDDYFGPNATKNISEIDLNNVEFYSNAFNIISTKNLYDELNYSELKIVRLEITNNVNVNFENEIEKTLLFIFEQGDQTIAIIYLDKEHENLFNLHDFVNNTNSNNFINGYDFPELFLIYMFASVLFNNIKYDDNKDFITNNLTQNYVTIDAEVEAVCHKGLSATGIPDMIFANIPIEKNVIVYLDCKGYLIFGQTDLIFSSYCSITKEPNTEYVSLMIIPNENTQYNSETGKLSCKAVDLNNLQLKSNTFPCLNDYVDNNSNIEPELLKKPFIWKDNIGSVESIESIVSAIYRPIEVNGLYVYLFKTPNNIIIYNDDGTLNNIIDTSDPQPNNGLALYEAGFRKLNLTRVDTLIELWDQSDMLIKDPYGSDAIKHHFDCLYVPYADITINLIDDEDPIRENDSFYIHNTYWHYGEISIILKGGTNFIHDCNYTITDVVPSDPEKTYLISIKNDTIAIAELNIIDNE